MKRIIVILFCLSATLATFAQVGPQKFSPEKFQAELQDYIVKEAKLTPQEAAKFLPLYSEMHQKQRAVYERQRQLRQPSYPPARYLLSSEPRIVSTAICGRSGVT